MRFIYALSLFVCVAVGFLAGTAYSEQRVLYMDNERTLRQYFKAGEKQGMCIANRMHLKLDQGECFK